MKKKYFLMGALAVPLLCACHSHQHGEEGHDHEAEMAGGAYHSAHEGEIILTEEKAQDAGIETETVRRGRFRHAVRTSGQVLPAQGGEATMVAPSSGVVRFDRTLAPGVEVGRGATLFRLSADRLEGGDPAERAHARYQVAKEEYERAHTLAEKQIVSQKELQALKAAYEDARLAYEALANGHDGRGVAVAAPMGGYVKDVAVKEGDFVATGQTLATVAQDRKLRLQADVPERHYAFLAQVASARFTTSYDGATYDVDSLHGRILSVGKTATAGAGYVPVTFEFDNAGGIVPGAYADVCLLGRERDGVISVPLSALTEEQGLYFVYLKEDAEVYRKQEVGVGKDDGQRVEILSGLEEGDRVVTRGAIHVKLASASNAIPAHTHSH